jgi:filamentous hemagglutinin
VPPGVSGFAKNIIKRTIRKTSDRLKKISSKGNKSSKVANTISNSINESNGELTGTVWDSIKEIKPVRKGTVIPEQFEISVDDSTFDVLPNATKHMEEKLVGSFKPGDGAAGRVSHNNVIKSQQILNSFQEAVKQASQEGIKIEEIVKIGGWELKFSAPRTGQTPLTKVSHARPIAF